MHARLEAGSVKIITRRGNDWTGKYPSIARALSELSTKSAYLDGELCGVLPDGRTAFNLIQNALEHGDASLVYFVFDLLFLDGEDLTEVPLIDRKTRLEASSSAHRTASDTATIRSVTAQPSTSSPASMAWRVSSRSGWMVSMSPTGAPG